MACLEDPNLCSRIFLFSLLLLPLPCLPTTFDLTSHNKTTDRLWSVQERDVSDRHHHLPRPSPQVHRPYLVFKCCKDPLPRQPTTKGSNKREPHLVTFPDTRLLLSDSSRVSTKDCVDKRSGLTSLFFWRAVNEAIVISYTDSVWGCQG